MDATTLAVARASKSLGGNGLSHPEANNLYDIIYDQTCKTYKEERKDIRLCLSGKR